jgi:hypothetical protein
MPPTNPSPDVEGAPTALVALQQPVPTAARRWLDYLTDGVAIICASSMLALKLIEPTVWSALVIGILTGRAALRIPSKEGGLPPAGSAVFAILAGLSSISGFRYNGS